MSRTVDAATRDHLRRVLSRTFGLKGLREGQEPVISRVLRGLPTLALMATGAGKSLCYQLPAMMLGGRTVVVTPLIALMKDQCDALQALGVAAVCVHSALSVSESDAANDAIKSGLARIVFTTPEHLLDSSFIGALATRSVELLVIDEAHCISQWGFDFRPSFLEIGNVAKALGGPTILALTATATAAVVDDITALLEIPRTGVIGGELYRPNLHFSAEHVSRAGDKLGRLVEMVRATEGCGIVYAATVKAAQDVHQALLAADESAGLYHGKLGAKARNESQDAFMQDRVRVMVATNAFGLGIDKPDIRFVHHFHIPPSLDSYYQEAGRAGRDGLATECRLLFVGGDKAVQQFFLAGRYPALKEFAEVLSLLRRAPPAVAGWDLESLCAAAEGTRRKLTVAVSVLCRRGLVSRDGEGRLSVSMSETDPVALEGIVQTYRDKADRDRASLEAMVAYAQSGRCRWQLLREHLDGVPCKERCGSCDNCVRLARHELEVASESNQVEDCCVPPFALDQRVHTRRHQR